MDNGAMPQEHKGPLNMTEMERAKVSEDLNRLRDDVSVLMGKLMDIGKEEAASFAGNIRASADRVATRIGEGVETGKARGKLAARNVEHTIEERPFLSVFLMFVVGLLLGRFLLKGSDR